MCIWQCHAPNYIIGFSFCAAVYDNMGQCHGMTVVNSIKGYVWEGHTFWFLSFYLPWFSIICKWWTWANLGRTHQKSNLKFVNGWPNSWTYPEIGALVHNLQTLSNVLPVHHLQISGISDEWHLLNCTLTSNHGNPKQSCIHSMKHHQPLYSNPAEKRT